MAKPPELTSAQLTLALFLTPGKQELWAGPAAALPHSWSSGMPHRAPDTQTARAPAVSLWPVNICSIQSSTHPSTALLPPSPRKPGLTSAQEPILAAALKQCSWEEQHLQQCPWPPVKPNKPWSFSTQASSRSWGREVCHKAHVR